jgi:hypothetical protein
MFVSYYMQLLAPGRRVQHHCLAKLGRGARTGARVQIVPTTLEHGDDGRLIPDSRVSMMKSPLFTTEPRVGKGDMKQGGGHGAGTGRHMVFNSLGCAG